MARFRKKPVVIEAEQFFYDVRPWPRGVEIRINPTTEWTGFTAKIRTLEGEMDVSEGDWIITGVKGERYSCKPDIFEMTYEADGGDG